MSTKHIRGFILQHNNPDPHSYIFLSSSDPILYTSRKYPATRDPITPHMLVKIRVPKKMPLPEIIFGSEYELIVKELPYKFTQNSVTHTGFSLMLVSIQFYIQ